MNAALASTPVGAASIQMAYDMEVLCGPYGVIPAPNALPVGVGASGY